MTDPRQRQQPWDTRLVEALSSFLADTGLERPGEAALELVKRGGRGLDDAVAAMTSGIGTNPNAPPKPPPAAIAGPVPSPFAATPPAPLPAPFAASSMGPPTGTPGVPMPPPAIGPTAPPPPPPPSLPPQVTDAQMGPGGPPPPAVAPPPLPPQVTDAQMGPGGSPPMPPPQIGSPFAVGPPPMPTEPGIGAPPGALGMARFPGATPGSPPIEAPLPDVNDPAAMQALAARQGGQFKPPGDTSPFDMGTMGPESLGAMGPAPGGPEGAYERPQHLLAQRAALEQGFGSPGSGPGDPFGNVSVEFSPYGTPPPEQMKRSPFDESRSIESYFSDASLAQRLQEAKRYARNDMLLGAGSAILSAPDLMSGLGAAGEAARGPRAELQRKQEELPLEYAKARFGVEGEREERDYRGRQEGRADETLGFARSENERREGESERTGRQFETDQTMREIALDREKPGGYNDIIRDLERQAAESQNAQLAASTQRLKDITANESAKLGLDKMIGMGNLLVDTANANYLNRRDSGGGSSRFRNMTAGKKLIDLLDSGELTPEDALADADVQSDPMLVEMVKEWQALNSAP